MYKLKPVFELENFSISSPMYDLKNIQVSQETGQVQTNQVDISTKNPILDEVEAKQDSILKQISEIKDLIAILKAQLSKPKIASSSLQMASIPLIKPKFLELGVIHEVVLHASVKYPPYSLFALTKLWPNIDFIFSWHIHSSLKGLPQNLKKFETIKSVSDGNKPQLRVRVVWNQVWSGCKLVVSPFTSVPLLGEVNFLRFLKSSLEEEQETSDVYNLAYFDSKLDACHRLPYCENIQQFQECYNILSEGLDNNKWLVGDNISIVDVACWSMISNLKNPSLNPALSRWFKDCDNILNK